MKSDSWSFIVMRSFGRIWAFRVHKRAFIMLGAVTVLLIGALAFFAYGYLSLLQERGLLRHEIKKLKNQAAASVPAVAVDQLRVNRRLKGGGFLVNFRLVNQTPQKSRVSGTLAIVARNDALQPSRYRVVPEMMLDKGLPQQPQKGTEFQVSDQKFVEAVFDCPPGETYQHLTVYVYSREGNLLVQRSEVISEE